MKLETFALQLCRPVQNTRVIDSLAIFCGGLCLFIFGSNNQEIINFETRFYLFALEMWRNGVSWFPTTYGKPYPDYPVTLTVFIYGVAKLFGELNKFTAVLPSAIASALTLVMTYLIGALHTRRWGWYAVGFLIFTFAFLSQARTISLDMFVTALTTGCFYLAYAKELKQKNPPVKRLMILLAMSFAMRGPIGLIIPTAVLCVFYGLIKNIRYALYVGCLAFLLLLVCCAVLFSMAYYAGGIDLLQDVLRMEIWDRMKGTAPPIYFYWLDSFGGYAITYPLSFLIMIGVAPKLAKSNLSADLKLVRLLFAWILIILLGLSIPADKKIRYVLAISPALALLCGYLLAIEQSNQYLSRLKKGFDVFCSFFPGLIILILLVLYYKKVALNYTLFFPLFLSIQLVILLGKRYKISFFLAILAFVLAYIFIFESLNLNLNRTRHFVAQVERLRGQQNANLVFYREGIDSLPLKYLINSPRAVSPFFISEKSELIKIKGPAFIVLRKKYLTTISGVHFKMVTKGKIGHDEVWIASV